MCCRRKTLNQKGSKSLFILLKKDDGLPKILRESCLVACIKEMVAQNKLLGMQG